MLKQKIILILFLFLAKSIVAQTNSDIIQQQEIRLSALNKIKECEDLLNDIILSGNIEERNAFILRGVKDIFEKKSSIEDDLNPNKTSPNSSSFVPVESYLESAYLFVLPEKVENVITFSNILISKVHQGDYLYVDIYFESLILGVRKGSKRRFKNVKRIATVKIYVKNNKIISQIASIRFASVKEAFVIENESESFEKSYTELVKNQKQNEKLFKIQYDFYIGKADAYFKTRDFINARENYIKALGYQSNDNYASDKISECDKQIEQSNKDNQFKQLIKEADDDFSKKRFYSAKTNYESADKLKPNDPHVKNMLARIERKLNPKYPYKTTGFVGMNYTFNETLLNNSTFTDGFKKDFGIDRFGISFYYPIGLYVSGIKTFKEKEPDYYYKMETVNQVKTELGNSNNSFTDLTFFRKGEHTGSFNTGIYLSFFRYTYFKLGISQRFGSKWDLYSGNLKGRINYSSSNSGLYAVNYESTNNTNFQAGVALVFSYAQLETTYDNYSQSIQISAGLNYPFRNVYFLKHNPTKIKKYKSHSYSEKKYPYETTKYIAVSFDFFNYFPHLNNDFTFSNLTSKSFESPISEKFSISYYHKFGFFISGFKKTGDNIPSSHYTMQEVYQKRSLLLSSNIPFTELKYFKNESNLTKVNLGIAYSFFRPLHFKVGFSYTNGDTWDVYYGDYKNYLIPFKGINSYAINLKEISTIQFVGGLALVFPFFQVEFMYDEFYSKYIISAGLNIPIRK